jgi:hypothetical protein
MRELLFVALLFGLLFVLGAISPLTLVAMEGLSAREAARAYEPAWEISGELEGWSNWIVDGDERFRATAGDWDRTFRRMEELIGLLCRELQAHGGRCRYEGY